MIDRVIALGSISARDSAGLVQNISLVLEELLEHEGVCASLVFHCFLFNREDTTHFHTHHHPLCKDYFEPPIKIRLQKANRTQFVNKDVA